MQADWEELAAIDRILLSETAEFSSADGTLDRRGELVERIAAGAKSLEELEELAGRNRKLTDWLLHWRRVALIESAALEQHLRFLQRAGAPAAAAGRIEVLG